MRRRPAPEPSRTRLGAAGFTLVELLVALGLTGIIGMAATSFLLNQVDAFGRRSEMFIVHQNARAALNRLSSDIRLAGRGLNHYDLEVPDLIVPNDGSVSVNVYTDSTISLLSIPDPASPNSALVMDPDVANNGAIGSTSVAADSGQDLSVLTNGSRIILFNPNSGKSQVLGVTGVQADTIRFVNDTLVFNFPATGTTPSQILILNQVAYRVSNGTGIPFLERRVDNGPWVRYIEGIREIRFAYFDINDNPFGAATPYMPTTAAQRRAIRWLRVTVVSEALRAGRRGTRPTITLTTDAAPRNMFPTP